MAIKLSKSRIARLPERLLLLHEIPEVKILTYFRFHDFYGGWLVYELDGRIYRQYLSWSAACKIFKQDSPFIFKQL